MNRAFFFLLFVGVLLASPPVRAQSPCGGMSLEKAAAILGCPVGEVRHRFSEEFHTCNFSKDLLHAINYALYREKDADSAQRSIEKVAEGLRLLVACKPVEGLDDAAFSCDGDRAKRLLVRKGPVWVDVISPADFKQKRQVAEAVLE
ncbi:MAG: hypothetical protein AB7E77_13190 [Desulfobulbus sp.]